MADCCVTLGTIERQCGGANAAGLQTTLHVACVDDIDVIPARDDFPTTGDPHTISTDITMVATKVFYEWAFSKVDHSYTVTAEGEAEFTTYNIQVQIVIPKLSPLTTYILNGTTGGEFVVAITDKNGQRRLIGNKTEGMTIQVQEATNDRNAYTVTFQMNSNELPLFYTGAIAV